jgi:hypothetical protein
MKIKSLRLALCEGGNPEYPTGASSSVNLGVVSTGAKAKRRQRATPRQFQRPASAAPEASRPLV